MRPAKLHSVCSHKTDKKITFLAEFHVQILHKTLLIIFTHEIRNKVIRTSISIKVSNEAKCTVNSAFDNKTTAQLITFCVEFDAYCVTSFVTYRYGLHSRIYWQIMPAYYCPYKCRGGPEVNTSPLMHEVASSNPGKYQCVFFKA